MGTSTIEISFPVEVDIPMEWELRLSEMVEELCKAYEKERPGRTMWLAGGGCKPQWSKADAAFLGKATTTDAPDHGEPTFDDSTLYFECSEREATLSDRIARLRSPDGGWSKEALASLGVSWPPPKGWKKALIEADRTQRPNISAQEREASPGAAGSTR